MSGEQRERLLVINGAANNSGTVVASSARYGWVDAKVLPAIADFTGSVEGDRVIISFTTIANSRIDVSLRAGEDTLTGRFVSVKGRRAGVRMTRISGDEVQALSTKAGASEGAVGRYPASGPLQVNRDSRISLVYMGAGNCPACRGCEAEYFGATLSKMKVSMPEFDQVEYVPIKLGGFRINLSERDLPAHLAWVAGDRPNGKPILRVRGVPAFFVAVDKEIWAQGHGVSGLEALVLPQARLAVSERTAIRTSR